MNMHTLLASRPRRRASTRVDALGLNGALRNHGVPLTLLHDVFRAIDIAKLTYCAPAWSGFSSASDRRRLGNFLKRCKTNFVCVIILRHPNLSNELFDVADQSLFKTALSNSHHVLPPLLPKNKTSVYTLDLAHTI